MFLSFGFGDGDPNSEGAQANGSRDGGSQAGYTEGFEARHHQHIHSDEHNEHEFGALSDETWNDSHERDHDAGGGRYQAQMAILTAVERGAMSPQEAMERLDELDQT